MPLLFAGVCRHIQMLDVFICFVHLQSAADLGPGPCVAFGRGDGGGRCGDFRR